MSHEIVPADSILDQETDGSSSSNHTYERFYDASSSGAYDYEANAENEETPYTFTRTRSLTYGRQHVPESFDSERLPAFLASGIHKFLLVANLLESEEPRVAYLCRFQAFEIAHRMDRNSTARGVRQFKTSLLQRLEQDEYTTLDRRKEETDTRELRRVYHAYKDYIFRNSGALNLEGSERERLINARRIASVLYEVLKTVTNAVDPQALADRDSIPNKPQFYVPYNILPLDQGGIQQPIMQLPEIKAAIAAVRNTRGLPSAPDFQKSGAFMDLFDFLHYCFGFQEGNVANQRENLILLLANIHIRQSHKQSPISEEAQQHKILYLGLYLLIWGEAANLRFMPECLCYIFHHMAYELHGILTGAVSTITGEKIMPAYGGAFESFLKNVVTPIYRVMYEEAQKSKNGTADHSKWRNYDDLNEFFWSPVCFEIGWPMRLEHDFFWVTNNRKAKNATVPRDAVKEKNNGEEKKDEEQGAGVEENCEPMWLGKTNFVEIRSFWQIFRSFDRMWSFYILCLQAMIIMACHDLESPLQVFDADVFEDIMSIFITSTILKLIQAIFDIAFTWKARRTMESSRKRKYMFKLFVAVIWTIVLPVLYAITIYLMTNAIELVLFFVPTIGKYIEISNWRICTMLSWWTQIKPLIEPTRLIMKIGVQRYDWHELFPKVKSNAGAIVAVWSPIIVVYFMDTQIWYSVFCTIFGGLYGILHHLGEIRTLGMLRSRFHTLPSAFNVCLIPPALRNDQKNKRIFFRRFHKGKKDDIAKFVLVWNQIVNRFRVEDLISNRELDLMTIPMSKELFSGIVRWPIFLLAHKFVTALSIARDFVGKDKILFRKIRKDKYMYSAVKECYESLKCILEILVVGDLEKRVISNIVNEIEESIGRSNLLDNFKMGELLALQAKCIELVELLVEGNETHHDKVVKVLQDIFELVTNDMMTNGSRVLDSLNSSQLVERDFAFCLQRTRHQLFADKNSIHFPLPDNDSLNEQIKRFLLLLSVKDKAMDIPANLEARRRISFFATSLFMGMPSAPKVRNMLSFSVLTPHFTEDINFSMKELYSSKEEVSIIFYMQKIYPERMGCENLDTLKDEGKEEELRSWASFRGQTLSRSVRGMMYYEEALKLQAFLDMAEDEDILEGYEAAERNNRTLFAQLDALSDMKFTYVVSCQMFGSQKASGDPRAQDMIDLMIRYPSLRVAYVEEKEVFDANKPRKVYSSILVKGVNGKDPGAEEIYRIKLPGPPNIGEGKPENQNHAIIFTRGEALQTIDMNQDNYLEEALKMRNLLQEFLQNHGRRPPTILGLREHIFTGSVSSLAWFMSYQETSFVTIGQRLLANPLRVRFHYGHPDVFDRVFHITRGGISKASKTINLSEDVFAGFNCTLRRGCITYHEYIQVGKGRDVGLNQISKFEAKVANGNSEQTLSRDIHRLGRRFDFFRMLSCYFTTIGFYFSSMLYLVLSGLQKALMIEAKMRNIQSLEAALASQSFIQLGLLTGLPMVMEIGLEKGFLNALKDFVLMQLQLAALFFTFSLGSKTHYYGRTILHGGAKYRPTGRKVVVFHASFTENYRLYSRSHFVKGFELLLLLIVYDLFRRSYQSNMAYVFITYSIWFMSITWLFAPFLFNPSGFSWGKIVDDWKDWNKWIRVQGGIGIPQDKSWHSWWIDEQAHLHRSGLGARLFEILLSLRFFIYQYGLVYHLDISQQSKNFLVYVLSWIVILAVFLTVKAVNMGRQQFSVNYHLVFRFIKAFLFLGILSTIISLSVICQLSFKDIIVCCLAFLPTGWGLILIAQAVRPKIENTGLWDFVKVLAKAYDYGMGVVLFTPIAVLAWLPIISAFQTRFLFNEAFNRHLQIQPILAGKKKHR
ncbi:putative callose synthase 8 [Citrus sinensis]|nr:putative callose synthase 8 [Citrus sinensis]